MTPANKKKLAQLISDPWADLIFDSVAPVLERIGARIDRLPVANLCPDPDRIFEAYHLTHPDEVRVVIIGQDPYINGEAHGLAFSSQLKVVPPSLKVIYREIERSIGTLPDYNPYLGGWARQGVFLLNRILTTVRGKSLTHEQVGWQDFTAATIRALAAEGKPIVYMLWGKTAQELAPIIINGYKVAPQPQYLLLEAPHPAAELYSGYKSGFIGCDHFNKANEFLASIGRRQIDWLKTSEYLIKAS